MYWALRPVLGWRRGFGMTRISAATAILFCVVFSVSRPALSQSTDTGCFPSQVYRGGQCVAKTGQEPPTLPAPTAPDAPAAPAPPLPPRASAPPAPPPPPPVPENP